MNRHYRDLFWEEQMLSRAWRLASACLAVALLIACLQWGRTWARAVQAEASAERVVRLEFGRGPAFVPEFGEAE